MSKIRLLFIAVISILLIGSLFLFNKFDAPMSDGLDTISEFKITQISGPGAIYMDNRPIMGTDFSRARTVDISDMDFENPVYLKADPQTSFEFYCFGITFTVIHNSYIHYLPNTRELKFFSGEYYWNQELKNNKVEILLPTEDRERGEIVQRSIALSERGRLRISKNSMEIWNFLGTLEFKMNGQTSQLESGRILVLDEKGKVKIEDILSGPEFIAPENKVITPENPAAMVVHFSWKAVSGAKNYKLKIYSSPLRENLLEEWLLTTGSKTVNLHKYNDFKRFYWQVIPYDIEEDREGIPSKMGLIKIVGTLPGQEDSLKPPRLVITSLTVSGNMVVIKGEAEINSQLFINEKPVTINMDGTFFETLNFRQIGTKTISFRLVAPTELETNITRQVTIFDE